MIVLKFAVTLGMIFLPSMGFALEEPSIVKSGGEMSLNMGADISKALKSYDSVFRPLRSDQFRQPVVDLYAEDKRAVPGALINDFNGDKINDLLLLGTSEKDGKAKVKAVLFVSSGDHYLPRLVEFWESNRYLTWVETRSGAKEIRNWHMYFKVLLESEKKILKSGGLLRIPNNTRGFKIMNYYGSGHPYYFKNGKIYTFSKTPPKE